MPSTYIPLFLDYKFEAPCRRGFTVEVTMKGRVLVEDDGKDQWVYGVNPGGIMARVPSSGDLKAALDAFSRKLRLVIADLSEVAQSSDQFKAEMISTFSTNAPYYEVWHKAIVAVRRGKVDVQNMGRENAETEPSLVMKDVIGSASHADKLVPEAKVAEAA